MLESLIKEGSSASRKYIQYKDKLPSDFAKIDFKEVLKSNAISAYEADNISRFESKVKDNGNVSMCYLSDVSPGVIVYLIINNDMLSLKNDMLSVKNAYRDMKFALDKFSKQLENFVDKNINNLRHNELIDVSFKMMAAMALDFAKQNEKQIIAKCKEIVDRYYK
jgi:hypothetical protein